MPVRYGIDRLEAYSTSRRLTAMTHPLLRLFNHWLFGDRVRVSCTEGQWFRLEVGQRLIAGERLLVVVTKEVISKNEKMGVHYGLVDYCAIPQDMKPLRADPVLLDSSSQMNLENRDGCLCMECFSENG